ncbi:PilN domain-containing protein [Roseofilum sp. BLCC_M154]|uniref:PilN domain-containing protein n=1 Tax=Roseofilum acuticapitatum BLCC-M154 TaxID=3022444 RepID=A0ABT7AQB3_9CYAN|nr:PilN domain-containing protein [Roseofilum acuticapitatum]MDJ1169092.1 PilN domain-containing protein [Roseofilum acuticapitatum BLCC-M154]
MYGLDINFLKDRPGYLETPSTTQKGGGGSSASPTDALPIIVGLVVGAAAVGATLGVKMAIFDKQNGELQAQLDGINANIEQQASKAQEIEGVQAQTQAIRDQTGSLATVFNQIKPWSALLQEIRDRAPATIQINTVEQIEVQLPDPNPPPETPNATLDVKGLRIAGTARTFDDVNDFMLLLKNSDFLGGDQTQLLRASLQANNTQVEVPEGSEIEVKLPDVVAFNIETPLSDKGASELMAQLESKGAIGLVSRIETLKQKGILE